MKKLISILIFVFALPLHSLSAAESPQVVVSIKPIHSLVSAIMEDVGTPQLIVKSGSPHGYILRPSEAKALAGADLVVWVGHELEGFLDKPLKTLAKNAKKLELAERLSSSLLTKRDTGNWEHSSHNHGSHEDQEGNAEHEDHNDSAQHEGHEDHHDNAQHEGHEEHHDNAQHEGHEDHNDNEQHQGHEDHNDNIEHEGDEEHEGHNDNEQHQGHEDHNDNIEHEGHEGHNDNEQHQGHEDHNDNIEHEGHESHNDKEQHQGHEDHNDNIEHEGHEEHKGHADNNNDQSHKDNEGSMDLHIWLSPEITQKIVQQTSQMLIEIDPANAEQYKANTLKLSAKITELDKQLKQKLAPVQHIPYLVFHSAYQYFETSYNLNAVGSVTIDPDRKPGAKTISEIRKKVHDLKARSVFSEPQFESSLVATIIEDTGATTAVLDPLGLDIPAGPEAYFQLMNRLADNLVDGLL